MSWISKLLGVVSKKEFEDKNTLVRTLFESLVDMIDTNHRLINNNKDLIDSNFEIIDMLMTTKEKKKKKVKKKK